MSRKKKHNIAPPGSSVELNVMPFIDIFSLLCTFLLFSAVFVSIGIIEVQAPFLTNAAPAEAEKKKDEKKKELTINIDIAKENISLRSMETDEKEIITPFLVNKEGMSQFQQALIKLKEKYPDAEKATVFADEEIQYEDMIPVFDALKSYEISSTHGNQNSNQHIESISKALFPKIIIGSIIL